MRLKTIGSSSKGNCYILEAKNGEILILEAGIHPRDVGPSIGFHWERVQGVLVTHEHQDHAKYIKDYQAKGIEVFATRETAEALRLNAITWINRQVFWQIGAFRMRWFRTWHDAAHPVGYIIQHPEMGNLLFLTDTAQIKHTFEGLNQIMIEANYDEDSPVFKGMPAAHIERVRLSHLSIRQTLDFLRRTDTGNVRNILLIHISQRHGDKSDFTARCRALGLPARIAAATPGLDLNISLTTKMEF